MTADLNLKETEVTETYTKLFSSILSSTVWVGTSPSVKLVWVVLLAKADRDGEIHSSVPGLAKDAEVSVEDCQAALDVLLSPDQYSRTTEFEGRRIEPIDGGWRLLNHAHYRKLTSVQDQREKAAARKRRQREREREDRVTPRDTPVTSHKKSHKAEADTEAEAEKNPPNPPGGGAVEVVLDSGDMGEYPLLRESPEFLCAWADWIAYRRECRFPAYKPRTVKAKLNEALAVGPRTAARAIREAIKQGWRGYFPDGSKGAAGKPSATDLLATIVQPEEPRTVEVDQ